MNFPIKIIRAMLVLIPVALTVAACTTTSGPLVQEPDIAGTGILLQHDDQEYVVTALHVAEACGFEPLIDIYGEWHTSTWEVIGTDKKNDVAVLQRVGANDSKIGVLAARYGRVNTVFGSIAVALGFPGATPPINWIRVEGNHRPVPMPVVTTLYFGLEDTYYTGGYINYGFSGGPLVAWADTHPTIVGIITKKAVTRGPDGTLQHAGLVGVADIGVAERIIAKHINKTMEEFRASKPQASSANPRHWNPQSLVTAEIMDAVIRLGQIETDRNKLHYRDEP